MGGETRMSSVGAIQSSTLSSSALGHLSSMGPTADGGELCDLRTALWVLGRGILGSLGAYLVRAP